ncbi:MAG: hypothetical protein ACYCY5_05895, partial [Sulfuricella sp.]
MPLAPFTKSVLLLVQGKSMTSGAVAAAYLISCFLAASATATPITFKFSGKVNYVSQELKGQFSKRQKLRGTYTFNPQETNEHASWCQGCDFGTYGRYELSSVNGS